MRFPKVFFHAGFAASVALWAGAYATPSAANTIVEEVTTAWRLENYISNNVVLWFVGAPGCTNGRIGFAAASQDDVNRFWSTVTSAKLSNRKVGIQYSGTGDACVVVSFWLGAAG